MQQKILCDRDITISDKANLNKRNQVLYKFIVNMFIHYKSVRILNIECYRSVKGVKNKYLLSKNKYSVSENKLLHTCTVHSKVTKMKQIAHFHSSEAVLLSLSSNRAILSKYASFRLKVPSLHKLDLIHLCGKLSTQ